MSLNYLTHDLGLAEIISNGNAEAGLYCLQPFLYLLQWQLRAYSAIAAAE